MNKVHNRTSPKPASVFADRIRHRAAERNDFGWSTFDPAFRTAAVQCHHHR